jgi:hypothetical protein
VITAGKFLVNDHPVVVLFDSGASHSFVSSTFATERNLNKCNPRNKVDEW